MQLEALKDLTPQVVERVLATAAVAPDDHDEGWSEYGRHAAAVLGEIRAKLKIRPDDTSASARARVDEELSKVIDAAVLGEAEFEKALARAGTGGYLSAGAYRIEFAENFKTIFKPIGERNGPVKRMIVEADDQQHLFLRPPEGASVHDDAADSKEMSLFIRRSRLATAKQHWVIIQTHRSGATLVVQAIWRVLPHVIDSSKAKDPLGLLRAFVAHYGVNVSVLGKRSKFTESVLIKGSGVSCGTDQSADIVVPNGPVFTIFNMRPIPQDNLTLIGNVYAIDLAMYSADVKSYLGTSLV